MRKRKPSIRVRLPDELVRRVDAAVKNGSFPSKSDAFRKILEEYLDEHPEMFLSPQLLSDLFLAVGYYRG